LRLPRSWLRGGRVRHAGRQAKQANQDAARRFRDCPTPTLADTPEIEVALIADRSTAPAGTGETALIAAVPALAKALRDASGWRATRLPVTFADLPEGAG
jgi:CO/xanthine dehydrogenase Mo-binding subunit